MALCLVLPLAPVRSPSRMRHNHELWMAGSTPLCLGVVFRAEETWIKYRVVMAKLRHTLSLSSHNMDQCVASKSIFFYKVVMCPAVHPFVSYGCLLPIQSRAKMRGRLSHLLGKEEEEGAMLKARGRLVVISAAGNDATFVVVARNPKTASLFTASP